MSVHVVVPARNEGARIAATIKMLAALAPDCITVIDNASTDDTATEATAAGAQVLAEPRPGKGFAVAAGVRSVEADVVLLCDADIVGLRAAHLQALVTTAHTTGAPLVRLAIGRSPEDAPVTTLAALPLLRALGMTDVQEPLGGLMLLRPDFLLAQHVPGGWGFDVAMTLAALRSAGRAPEIAVTGIRHRRKSLADYRDMAEEVVAAVLAAEGLVAWDHRDCTRCQAERPERVEWAAERGLGNLGVSVGPQ